MAQALLECRFAARAEELSALRQAVRDATSAKVLPPLEAEKLVLAVNEACMNVIQHAYKGRPDGEIVVKLIDTGEDLEVSITDFAEPVAPEKIQPRVLTDIRPGGLGTHFMRELMDDVSYMSYDEEGIVGNRLVMRKHKQEKNGGTST